MEHSNRLWEYARRSACRAPYRSMALQTKEGREDAIDSGSTDDSLYKVQLA